MKALDEIYEIYKIYTRVFGEKRTEIENGIMKMCTFGIQEKNHEKRFGQASYGLFVIYFDA